MKIVSADPDGKPLTEAEVEELFAQPLNLRLGFVDADGWPVVHPIWFHYESSSGHLWVNVAKESLKARSLRASGRAYFTVDTEGENVRGVRGRVRVEFHDDRDLAVKTVRDHILRYMGTLEGPIQEKLLGFSESGETVCIELIPEKFATWAY